MPHLQIKELRVTIIKQFLQPSGCLFSTESHRFPWLESTMMFAQLKHQKSFTSSPGWVLVRAMHQGDIHSVPQLWQESLLARVQTASPSSVFTPAKRQRMKEESHRPPFVCSVHSGSPLHQSHLSALTGLPTSISCQRCSKMVARAAFRCTGKRGSLLRMEWMRKGRGGGKRQCSGGRGEREGRINNNPSSSSFSVFQSSFASFPSVMW